MEIRDRKRVIFFVRIGLVLATIVFVFSWIGGRVSNKVKDIHVQSAPVAANLGAGDVQILTTDGNFDVTLSGDRILAGLSDKMVAKVRDEMAKSSGNDSGLGAVIAGAVKSSVASAIGTHISYQLSNLKELRYEDGKLIVVTNDGDAHGLSGDSKDGNSKEKAVFAKADAQRLIEAVNARKKELGLP